MNLKIRLAYLNDIGSIAFIGDPEEMEAVTVAEFPHSCSGYVTCKDAADNLRMMAEKFDELAEAKDPFDSETQQRVNESK